jgi:hypothetical protein
MPLEGMDAYDSDAGSDVDPHGSDVVADSLQGSEDQNATEADSNDEGSEAQKFDGQQSDSDQHTPAQKSKRLRAVSPASEGRDEFGDGASDLESICTERDELFGPRGRKRGYKRPRIEWELVSSWNKDHVAQEDYEGEIARIMAKSLMDSKTAVSPKYNRNAISNFRYKTVRSLRFYSAH